MTASWSPWGTLTGWALAAGNDSEVTLLRGAVVGVVGWVVTTPLRRVAWAFADSMLEACSSAYVFVYTCGDRYLKTVRGEEALVLPPRAYVWALVILSFLIPIAVLRDYEARSASWDA
ncbi:hypothetical protein PInf_021476 [Phytophthora infestans]|nr:hypothetical protein PInf_021476 [Phytophthora infestans]